MAEPQLPNHANDALERELTGFFARTDPVPGHVLDAARAAIEFRDLDGQLAELLRDSAAEDKELAGVRGIGQRLLSFALGEQFVELDIATDGDRRHLTGYVVPAGAGTLRAQHADGTDTTVPVDEQGRFRLSGLSQGPVRLWIELAEHTPFRTPWLTV
jgi:hypothetical protein